MLEAASLLSPPYSVHLPQSPPEAPSSKTAPYPAGGGGGALDGVGQRQHSLPLRVHRQLPLKLDACLQDLDGLVPFPSLKDPARPDDALYWESGCEGHGDAGTWASLLNHGRHIVLSPSGDG